MSGVLNDCDALLQSASVRIFNGKGAVIILTPSAPGFHLTSAGVADLSVVTVKADLLGLDGPISFSVTGGTLSNITATSADVTYTGGPATVTATVTSAGVQFVRSCIVPVLRDGATGSNGTNGTNGSNGVSPPQVATAYLYQWTTATPAKPNSTSTFSWAAGVNNSYGGTDGWSVIVPANPGTPLAKLFVASIGVTAAAGATSTSVTYSSSTVAAWSQNGGNGVDGTNGTNGVNGVQSDEAAIYQWAATIPAGPTGAPSFVWATRAFGAAPTNWALTPGTSPTPGYTLWKAAVRIVDTANATSTPFNWTSASITAIGSAGTAGTPAMWVDISSTSNGQVFSRATSAAAFAPTSITLTATPYGGAASAYQWQYWSGSAWTNITGATAATYAVASGDFTNSRVYRVQATIAGTVYTDEFTLVQVTGGTNGVNAIVGFLTNETAALAADSVGTLAAGALASAGGTFKVFDGVTDKTGTSVTYSIPAETGCDVSITTAGVYSLASMTADQATATLQAVYGGVTIQKTLTLVKAKAGASTAGAEGASYVTAYCASATVSTTTAPASTSGRNSVPVTNGGGITGTWSKTVPALTSGQFMYQSDGIYNPANDTVTWSIPYWSALKVGSLSAIAANLGQITGGSIDIGTGATSWHVDSLGNTWAGAPSFGSAPYRVSNTGAATFSSIDILGPGGTVVLSSGKALAQQVRISPNLVPNVKSWKYAALGASAYGDSANTANGEYINLPATAGTVYLETDIVVPSAGGTFTLSCLANALTAGADFAISIVGSPSVNLQPIYSALTATQQRFTATFTIPANTSGLRIRAYTTSAKGAQIADVKLETGSNATAWSSDVITAGNASTFIQAGAFGTLSAYAAYIGSMEIGAGGNIRQGMTDYGVGIGMWFGQHQGINKFIIGNPNASMMWWDGSQLQTQNLSLINPSFGTFTASLSGAGITSSGPNETRALGSRQIIGSGGKLPYRSFSWTVTDLEGNSAASTVISGETTDTVSVTASGTNAVTRVRITGTITDANGLTASASFITNATFGTP